MVVVLNWSHWIHHRSGDLRHEPNRHRYHLSGVSSELEMRVLYIYHFVIYDLLFILSFSHLGHLVHSNTHYVVADTVTDDDDLAVLNQLLAVSCWLLADVLYAGSGGFVLDDTCAFD